MYIMSNRENRLKNVSFPSQNMSVVNIIPRYLFDTKVQRFKGKNNIMKCGEIFQGHGTN